MKLSVEQFSHEVVACGLLTAADLGSVTPSTNGERDGDSTKLAQKLVSAGKLTKYQAANAVQGKAKNLVFGEYVIIAAIGAGGMGQVFKAEHRRMKRIVALKVLPLAAVKSPEAVKRFQQEVQAAARLEHANIVTAHDAGEAHGVHYLVMQYVDGRDLASLVAERGALPVPKAIDYILQAAHGLAYAHGKGVIHRDIKPANLLLSNEGVIKILDMGIARLDDAPPAAGKQPMTTSGEMMGTADYMAPEQGDDAHQADARADIYSLGCTLHFLLAGQPPYGGSTLVQKVMAHRDQSIPSLALKRGDLPPLLDQVFARMVAKKPAERFQTMQEVAAALESLGTVGATTRSTAWAAPVKALTDGATTFANAPGETTASVSTVASLLEHEVVKKTWSATAKMAGALFGTIIAPILVTFILKVVDKPAGQAAPGPAPSTVAPSSASPAPSTAAATPAAPAAGKSESPVRAVASGTSPAATDKIASLPPVDHSAGRPVDVMALIDLKRDVLRGNWTLRNNVLHGPAAQPKQSSQLQLPVRPPADYDLVLSIGRPVGAAKSNVGFSVAVVVEERHQVGVLIDHEGNKEGRHWGLEVIAGRGPFANGTMAKDKPILGSTPVNVAVKVRRGEVAVTCHNTPVFDWRGSADQLSLPRGWTDIPSEPALLFVTRAEVDIHEIKFVPGGGDWSPLFNGRNLRGWAADDATLWKVDAKTGEVVGKGGRSQWILTDRDHRDFRLRLELQMGPGTNSGICFRAAPEDKEPQYLQLELATAPLKPKVPPAGTLRNAPTRGQNVLPATPARLKPAGSWNELEIDLYKNRLRVWLNGDRLHDADLAKLSASDDALPALKRKSGRIGLQSFGGEVRFRKVVIHETDTKAAR